MILSELPVKEHRKSTAKTTVFPNTNSLTRVFFTGNFQNINPLLDKVHILNSLKTPENQSFLGDFRSYKM